MNVITTQNTPVFNHTEYVNSWQFIIDTLSGYSMDTINNTPIDLVSRSDYEDLSVATYAMGKGLTPSIQYLQDYYHVNWSPTANLLSKNPACEYAEQMSCQESTNPLATCKFCPLDSQDGESCINGILARCIYTYAFSIDVLLRELSTRTCKDHVEAIETFFYDLQTTINYARLIQDWPVKSGVLTK